MSSERTDYSENGKPHAETIERVRTAAYVPGKHGEEFERTFLAPEIAVQGDFRKRFGNPTPIALVGFLMANTPATIDLMGWRGAGGGSGNAGAGTASYMYFGGLLLFTGGVGEWILGNTFPATVFCSFAGFWFTFGGTLMPFYNALAGYTTTDAAGNTVADPAGFYDSFAYFLIFMGVLCGCYAICALRTNIILVFVLMTFVLAFPCLTASYFFAAMGEISKSTNCRIAGGAFAFSGSMAAWWLFLALLFESVDFPISLPVGDLSGKFKGKTERAAARSQV